MPPTPCDHDGEGLCPTCQADYEADPTAWEEFGHHKRGRENWWALQEELAERERIPDVPPDEAIPF